MKVRLGTWWAMLFAAWAFVLLAAAPLPAPGALCGAPTHHPAHQDCTACCPCAAPGPAQALPTHAAPLPPPRGALLAAASVVTPPTPAQSATIPFRARGPPGAA